MRAGDQYENPVSGQRVVVLQPSKDTGGEYLRMEEFVRPGGRLVLPHVHVGQTETFEVLEGRLGALVGSRRFTADQGETITVAPGTEHDWWNDGDTELHVEWELRGPGVARSEAMLETLGGLMNDGKINKKGLPNPLQMAVMGREFKDVFRPASPPPIFQDVLLGLLAPIGGALGYQATYEKYSTTPSDREERRRR
jgi:mannose-6-phosphate isomerase-like protein (cupin superfamily)